MECREATEPLPTARGPPMAVVNADLQAAGVRRGELVEVRSLGEILATLDAEFKFEGVPFMPEMVPHCGRRFRVYRRAEKTCVEGIGIQRMRNTVFLEGLRCDGSAHDGCQRQCLMFWKEAWLKRLNGNVEEDAGRRLRRPMVSRRRRPNCRPARTTATSANRRNCWGPPRRCRDWNLRAYLRDLRLGEATPWLLRPGAGAGAVEQAAAARRPCPLRATPGLASQGPPRRLGP